MKCSVCTSHLVPFAGILICPFETEDNHKNGYHAIESKIDSQEIKRQIKNQIKNTPELMEKPIFNGLNILKKLD